MSTAKRIADAKNETGGLPVMFRVALAALTSAVMFGSAALADEQCSADGYSETVLTEAEVEYGDYVSLVYLPQMSTEVISIPAIYDHMSREAYEQLPEDLSYEEPFCTEAVIKTRPATNITTGAISDYDIIRRADGSDYKRPLDPSIMEINSELTEYYVAVEAKKESVKKTMPRPRPLYFSDGGYGVLKSPPMTYARCLPHVTKTVTKRYVKTRKPALILKTPCKEE